MSLTVQLVTRSSYGLLALPVFADHRRRIGPYCVDGIASRLKRIRFDERGNLPFVVGVALGNHGPRIRLIITRLITKAGAPGMINKDIGSQEVLPTFFRCPQTPIVFFAIASAKGVLVKAPHIIDCGTAQIHAETHASWNLYHLTAVNLSKQRIDSRVVKAYRQIVVFAEVRV